MPRDSDPNQSAPKLSGPKLSARAAIIIVLYIAVFWLALPASLAWFGVGIEGVIARVLSLATFGSPPLGLRLASGFVGALFAFNVARAMVQLSTRGHGLPVSHLPPTDLVTVGAYARCRHPIYVAYNAAFSTLALAAGSWGASIGGGLLLLLAWIIYAIAFEEPRLCARFGASYETYRKETPLFPRLSVGRPRSSD